MTRVVPRIEQPTERVIPMRFFRCVAVAVVAGIAGFVAAAFAAFVIGLAPSSVVLLTASGIAVFSAHVAVMLVD